MVRIFFSVLVGAEILWPAERRVARSLRTLKSSKLPSLRGSSLRFKPGGVEDEEGFLNFEIDCDCDFGLARERE